MSKAPLSGKLVIDLSQNLPGPYCSRLLADQGARVIKVEAPKRLDLARQLKDFHRALNAGKECLSVDLKNEEDREILYKLVKKADVFIESFRPGVVTKLGVDYKTLKKINPKLVYCSISGYGQEGEYADIPAHDINLQAMAGWIGFTGRRFRQSTEEAPLPIADMVTSLFAHSAIVSALLSGKGQYVDMPMADGLAHMVYTWQQTTPKFEMLQKQLKNTKVPDFIQELSLIKKPLTKYITRGVLPALPHYGVIECANNTYLCLGIVDEQHFWKTFCKEVGGILEKMHSLNMLQRSLFAPVIQAQIKRILRQRTAQYWYEKLAVKHNLPISIVVSSDKFTEQDYFQDKLDENGVLKSPLRHSTVDATNLYKPGYHNEQILKELGLSK